MVLLEAMGSAVPVITTPVEGIAELVDHGRNGLLVPVDDVAALHDALRSLLDDSGRRAELGQAGRATVVSGHTADRMAEGIESVYEEVAQLLELRR